MIPGALARRYARALIELASNPTQRDKFARDIESVTELLRASDSSGTNALKVIATDRFPLKQRQSLVRALAARVMADEMVVKFLELVVARGRGGGIPDIARAYRKLADEAAGRVQAEITSAAPLPPDALTKIKVALEQATGKTVIASSKVDPELLGGVVAKVGSYVIDGSLRTSLAQLRNSMRQ